MTDKDEDTDAAKAVNWQPGAVEDATIDDVAGLNKGKDDFPNPTDESADKKEENVI